MEMKYHKSAAKLLSKGLDLSKEVLWVSVYQRAAKLQAVKVGIKKKSTSRPGSNLLRLRRAERQNFLLPPTLTANSSASL